MNLIDAKLLITSIRLPGKIQDKLQVMNSPKEKVKEAINFLDALPNLMLFTENKKNVFTFSDYTYVMSEVLTFLPGQLTPCLNEKFLTFLIDILDENYLYSISDEIGWTVGLKGWEMLLDKIVVEPRQDVKFIK